MQDFKHVLDLNCKQNRTEQLGFFNRLSNAKNLVLSNGSKYGRNVIQRYYNSFIFKNIYEKSPSGWGLSPQTPVGDTFELQYTSLLKSVSQFRHLRILPIGLTPLPRASS